MRAAQLDPREIAALDKVMHEPARLSIVACLYAVADADFVFLQSQTGMTGGNLSAHLKKLEQAAYIQVTKEFVDGRPHTTLSLTKQGRDAFREYLRTLRTVLTLLE